jgi:hypothetical protein
MMALLPISLFVMTDKSFVMTDKLKYDDKMYSNDEKTDMILIYGECNKNAFGARLCRQ